MAALSTLFPVFAMIFLGMLCRIKKWVTPEQKAGANTIIFNILFPVLIFKILLTASIDVSSVFIVLYVLVMFLLAMAFGALTGKMTAPEYAHIVPYMLTTCEGGNVALPLYLSIVGSAYASNTVIFDLAGTVTAFIVIPVLVAKSASGTADVKTLFKSIVTNSFIIAVALGLVLNLTGLYSLALSSPFGEVITGTLDTLTSPISSLILFLIGYDLKADMETLPSLLKVMVSRIAFMAVIIAGFFVVFRTKMMQKEYMTAVMLYFMCPTGFAMPALISPAYKDPEQDNSFLSAFISLYMIVTLIVYTVLVIWY